MRTRWRVAIGLIASIGLLVTALGVSRAKPTVGAREERIPYSLGQSRVYGVDTERGLYVSTVQFEIRSERFLELSVEDALGTQVTGSIVGQREGLIENFCGATEGPIRVRPYQVVEIQLLSGQCDDGTLSFPTQGDVVATMYKRRP